MREMLDPRRFIPRLEHNVKVANATIGLNLRDNIKTMIVSQKGMTGKGSEGPGKLHPFTVHRRNTRKLDEAASAKGKGGIAARRIQSRAPNRLRGKRRVGVVRERGPLKPYRTKRGAPHKRLIDKGQAGLLGAITFQVRGLAVVVGVLAQTKGGVDIAKIQEFGKVITVTPKMRGWLHAKGLHLKPSTTKIEIPGQGYIRRGLKGSERVAVAEWEKAILATVRSRRL